MLHKLAETYRASGKQEVVSLSTCRSYPTITAWIQSSGYCIVRFDRFVERWLFAGSSRGLVSWIDRRCDFLLFANVAIFSWLKSCVLSFTMFIQYGDRIFSLNFKIIRTYVMCHCCEKASQLFMQVIHCENNYSFQLLIIMIINNTYDFYTSKKSMNEHEK